MADVDTRLRVDNTDAARGIAQFKKDLNSIPAAAQRSTRRASQNISTTVGRQFDTMRRGARDLRTLIGEIAIGFGAGALVRSLFNVNSALVGATTALGAFTDSAAQTRAELDVVQGTAQRLGLDMLVLTEQWTKLRAATESSKLTTREVWEIFEGLAETTRVLNLDAQRTEGVFRAVIQMFSKGKVQAEELRGQMGEHIPGAFILAAKAFGVADKELDKMIADGRIMADELVPLLGEQFRETFGPALADAVQTSQSELARLKNDITIFVRDNQSIIEGSFTFLISLTRDLLKGYELLIKFEAAWINFFAGIIAGFKFVGSIVENVFKSIYMAFIDFLIDPLRAGFAMIASSDSSLIPQGIKDFAGNVTGALEGFIEDYTPQIDTFAEILERTKKEFDIVDNVFEQLFNDIATIWTRAKNGIDLTDLINETFGAKSGGGDDIGKLTEDQLKKINQLERGMDGLMRIVARFRKMREDIIDATTLDTGGASEHRERLLQAWDEMLTEDIQNWKNAHIQKKDIFNQFMNDINAQIRNQFARDMNQITALQARNIISDEEALLARERLQAIFNIDSRPFFRGMRQELEFLGQSLDTIAQKIQETMGGLAAGAINDVADAFGRAIAFGESFKDAMNQIGRTIVAEIISALAKMGIQMLLNFILGQTLQKAAMAQVMAASTASAAAWATPAYLASVATLGGAAATGTASLLSGLVASNGVVNALQGLAAGAMGGGRAFGGPVNQGKVYPVNELGDPEVYRTRTGRQYLLPAENGIVEPMKRAERTQSGSAGQANVTVNIVGAPSTPQISQRAGSNGLEIDVLFDRIDKKIASGLITGESQTATAIERTYGTQRNRGRY